MKTRATFIVVLSILYFVLPLQAQVQVGGDIDSEAAFDRAGWSVSMPDANTVAIGANYNNGNGTDCGHVRIYSWNGSWVQMGSDIDGETAGDQSGYSVSMPDAQTVAIGAPFNDGIGSGAGHVRIYSWNGSSWSQKGADIDGKFANDFSGCAVSMPDANTVAIGAYGNDANGSNSGHVRVFTWNGSAWLQKGVDLNGEALNDNSGWSVSMPDANTVAIGARLNDGSAAESGHVRIYSWTGSAWTQMGTDINGENANDHSGWSVSMPDASTVAIGATGNDGNGTNSGQVRVYSWNGSTWTLMGSDLDGENYNDESGTSVSMPDANTVAIGAPGNSANGNWAGHTRIYSWDGNTWIQMGNDIDGEAANDASGTSVSMPDAMTVAIGAYLNGGNGTSAGHVRVFGNIPTGLAENRMEDGILFYPNPATNQLIVHGMTANRIEIFDVLGMRVFYKELSAFPGNKQEQSIDIRHLTSGLYFVKVQAGKNERAVKFVKQ